MANKDTNEVGFLQEKFPHGHPSFIPMSLDELELHSSKNADYARGGDPLGNFHRVANFLTKWGLEIPPSLVAFLYMLKQVDAVGNMLVNNYEGQVEGVAQRLQDISVYAKLVQILCKEEQKEE